MALHEKSVDESYYNLSSGDHEYVNQFPQQSIQYLMRYINKKLKSQPHVDARGKVRSSPK